MSTVILVDVLLPYQRIIFKGAASSSSTQLASNSLLLVIYIRLDDNPVLHFPRQCIIVLILAKLSLHMFKLNKASYDPKNPSRKPTSHHVKIEHFKRAPTAATAKDIHITAALRC
jgi:hypothetical protein